MNIKYLPCDRCNYLIVDDKKYAICKKYMYRFANGGGLRMLSESRGCK